MKTQETLEEAALKYAKQFDYAEDSSPLIDFVEGAKWQQERMYSEEELKETYLAAIQSTGEGWNGEYAGGNNPDINEKFTEGFVEWFTRFKKK